MTAPECTSGLTVALIVVASPFVVGALVGLALGVAQRIRKRREDRERAAGIAERVHDRQYLDWLEEQFASEGSAS